VHSAVPLTFANPSDALLEVSDSSLDFHACQLTIQTQKQIPAPTIAWMREQDFMQDGVRRAGDEDDESPDRRLLTAVSQWVPKGAEACREVKPEYGANLAKPRHGDALVPKTLEPTHFGLRPSELRSHGLLAQTGCLARHANFGGEASDEFIAAPPPALDSRFTCSHARIMGIFNCSRIGRDLSGD